MKVRRIKSSEHSLVRKLRMEALRDSPNSFAESEYDVSQKPESYWIELTQSLTENNVMFLIEADGKVRGSVFGIQDKETDSGGRIGGMWVSSNYRNRGFGQALLKAVTEWAQSSTFTELRLWVPTDNQNAKSFYTKADFTFTGKTKNEPFALEEMIFQLS